MVKLVKVFYRSPLLSSSTESNLIVDWKFTIEDLTKTGQLENTVIAVWRPLILIWVNKIRDKRITDLKNDYEIYKFHSSFWTQV